MSWQGDKRYNCNGWTFLDLLECSLIPENQDVNIICDGSNMKVNSFLLVSILPVLQKYLTPSLDQLYTIFMPDVKISDLTHLISSVYNKKSVVLVPKSLIDLTGVKYIPEETSDVVETIKRDIEDSEDSDNTFEETVDPLIVLNDFVKMNDNHNSVPPSEEEVSRVQVDVEPNYNITFQKKVLQDEINEDIPQEDFIDNLADKYDEIIEEIKAKLIENNPSRSIRFILSQRHKIQLVLDDYVFGIKKGPFMTQGEYVIQWSCIFPKCNLLVNTRGGLITENELFHDHKEVQPIYSPPLILPPSNNFRSILPKSSPKTEHMIPDDLRKLVNEYNMSNYQEDENIFYFSQPSHSTIKDSKSNLSYYAPKHLVPDDLKQIIVASNPQHGVKFTMSQRGSDQILVDEYLLKKKKGPYLARNMRVINWRCVKDPCGFSMVTCEGRMKNRGEHNHSPDSSLFIRQQTRTKLRESMENFHGGVASDVVREVLSETNVDDIGSLGSVDALKQAARRYNRKLRKL